MIRPTLSTAALAAALAACPAIAQVIPTGTPAADILLSRAIAEHRVFLTCSALEPPTHQQILTNWQRDVTAAANLLAAQNVPAEAITAFAASADPAGLMPADDTSFGDVRQLCDANADWQKTYYEFHLTILELKLPKAFE